MDTAALVELCLGLHLQAASQHQQQGYADYKQVHPLSGSMQAYFAELMHLRWSMNRQFIVGCLLQCDYPTTGFQNKLFEKHWTNIPGVLPAGVMPRSNRHMRVELRHLPGRKVTIYQLCAVGVACRLDHRICMEAKCLAY